MNVRAFVVVVSSIVSIGGTIGGCGGDEPAVSAETSTGPSTSGNEDPSTSVDPESSGPSSATDPTGDSSGTTTSSTGTTTEGESSEGSSSGSTTEADSSSTGDASSEGSSGGSTDTGGETGVVDGCDPLAQNCPDGQACYPFMAEFDCYGISEAGAQGDGCGFVDVCDAGLFCAAAAIVDGCMDAVGCCSAFCDISDPMDACQDISPAMFCIPWYAEGDAPPGLELVGACAAV